MMRGKYMVFVYILCEREEEMEKERQKEVERAVL